VRRTCLAGVAALSLGCYTYSPTTLDAVPVGTRVRALMSTEAELRLRDSLHVDMRSLDGTLVDREEGRLTFEVQTAVGSATFGGQALYQRIALAPQDVLRVDTRRLHPARTAGLALAVAGLGAFIAVETFRLLRPGSPDNGGGGPPEHLAPSGW